MADDTEKPVCDYCRKKTVVQEQFNPLEIKIL